MERAKLFVGLLTAVAGLEPQVRADLEKHFGPVDVQSPTFNFDFTDYYQAEMGDGLKRVFFSFQRLIDPAELASVKVRTNQIEVRYRDTTWPMPRPINLDPGYLQLSKLVLASTKDFFHRIYLGQGIYAEVTMYFRGKSYRALDWTYPDYRSGQYERFFLQVRDIYRKQVSSAGS